MRADQREFIPLDSNVPLRGLATSPPSTRLNTSLSPNLMNVTVRDGVIRRRAGYLQLGERLIGKILGITEFGPIGSDPLFVVFTDRRQYAYDHAADDFVDLTPNQVNHSIISVNQGTKTFEIAGDQTSIFVSGFTFPLIGGANGGIYTTVSSSFPSPNTEIIVEETIPSPSTAGNIVTADEFATPAKNTIDFAGVTDVNLRQLIVTNGFNKPRTWDGTLAGRFIDWDDETLPIGEKLNFPDFLTCTSIATFRDHLFLGGLTLTGPELQSIAWSNAGDFSDFVAGSSGQQLLHEVVTQIQRLEPLGDRLAVYSDDTIHLATFIGDPAIFLFEAVIPDGTRLAASGAVVSIDLGHVYVAEENFYIFDGSRGVFVLGEAIYNDYKGRKDHENLHLLNTLNDFSKRTLFFAVPDISGGATVFTAVYDLRNLSAIAWAREQYNDAPTAFGFFTNRFSYTWDDAPWEPTNMKWEEELGPWGGEGEQVEFPVRTFGSANGDVFIVTEGVFKDNGVAVEELYETLDFTLPSFQSVLGRAIEVEFEAWGTKMDISISLDKGFTYQAIKTDFALTPSPQYHTIPIDQSARTMRIRFRSLEDFSLSQVRLWVRPGAPR